MAAVRAALVFGGFVVADVPDEAQARHWAGKMAVAVGWPQEVHRPSTLPGQEAPRLS